MFPAQQAKKTTFDLSENWFNEIQLKQKISLTSIWIVPATEKDWDYILKIRNDSYDFFYIQNRPILKAEHYEYMKKQKNNPNFHHWVISYKNKIVGYVRILNYDVSIMIEEQYQNFGIGQKVLELVENEAKKLKIKKLVALIKLSNKSSERIFIKNNYEHVMQWYEKKLIE